MGDLNSIEQKMDELRNTTLKLMQIVPRCSDVCIYIIVLLMKGIGISLPGSSASKHGFRIHLIEVSSHPYLLKTIMDATTVLDTSAGVPHAKTPHPHTGSTAPVPSQPNACTPHLAKYSKSRLRG